VLISVNPWPPKSVENCFDLNHFAFNRMVIFLDLDGPILDVSQRYFRVHWQIVRQAGGDANHHNGHGADAFWALKRNRVGIAELVRRYCPGLNCDTYLRLWLEHIETREFIRHDVVQPGAVEALEKLRSQHTLCLVTLRRNHAALKWELKRLGLAEYFAEIRAGHSLTEPGWKIKTKLIRSRRPPVQRGALIVGDTEVDILAGHELDMTTVAVTNGIRTRELLQKARPDFIIPGIAALPVLLESRRGGKTRRETGC